MKTLSLPLFHIQRSLGVPLHIPFSFPHAESGGGVSVTCRARHGSAVGRGKGTKRGTLKDPKLLKRTLNNSNENGGV